MSFWLVQNPSSYLSFQLVWNLSWMPDKSERLRTSRNDPTSGNDNPETFLMNSLVSSCLYSPPLVKGGARGDFTKMKGRERLSMKSPLPFAKEGLNFINHWDIVLHV